MKGALVSRGSFSNNERRVIRPPAQQGHNMNLKKMRLDIQAGIDPEDVQAILFSFYVKIIEGNYESGEGSIAANVKRLGQSAMVVANTTDDSIRLIDGQQTIASGSLASVCEGMNLGGMRYDQSIEWLVIGGQREDREVALDWASEKRGTLVWLATSGFLKGAGKMQGNSLGGAWDIGVVTPAGQQFIKSLPPAKFYKDNEGDEVAMYDGFSWWVLEGAPGFTRMIPTNNRPSFLGDDCSIRYVPLAQVQYQQTA